MKLETHIFLAFMLFLGQPASAQKVRPISANGRPLTFQVVRTSITREPQSTEQVSIALTGFDLQAASSQRGYTYHGPTAEDIHYQPIPLTDSESFLLVEFSVSNVKRLLQLSTEDVKLIDGRGSAHRTLGCIGHKENSWFPLNSEELNPKSAGRGSPPNRGTWIFKVSTDAISGAVIQFQNATYPFTVAK
jgi:hypothetical protein